MNGAAEVGVAVAEVDRALRLAHAGGLELVRLGERTAVVRFTRMCTACPARALCLHATVAPALRELDSVERVHAEGVALSPAAAARLAETIGASR
jgi:Fe-S cluster biogenesis protein NfuA